MRKSPIDINSSVCHHDLMLEATTLNHAQGILNYMLDDAASGDAWFERPKTLDEVKNYIQGLKRNGVTMFSYILNGEVVGLVTLKPVGEALQVGFFVATHARGTGLAHHVRSILSTVQGEVIAWPDVKNTRCQKFLINLGFRNSGHMSGSFYRFIKDAPRKGGV